MIAVTLKPLKTKIYNFADGQETVARFAVQLYGERVGTVHQVTSSSGASWFDPLAHAGDNCRSNDGLPVTKAYVIQRRRDLMSCVKLIVRATSGRPSDLKSIDLSGAL